VVGASRRNEPCGGGTSPRRQCGHSRRRLATNSAQVVWAIVACRRVPLSMRGEDSARVIAGHADVCAQERLQRIERPAMCGIGAHMQRGVGSGGCAAVPLWRGTTGLVRLVDGDRIWVTTALPIQKAPDRNVRGRESGPAPHSQMQHFSKTPKAGSVVRIVAPVSWQKY